MLEWKSDVALKFKGFAHFGLMQSADAMLHEHWSLDYQEL